MNVWPTVEGVLRTQGIIAGEQPTIGKAAIGDLESLRHMADAAYYLIGANEADPDIAMIAFVEAITFARLAAAHGEERDRETLMFLLSKFAERQQERGRRDLSIRFEAASLNIASDMADEGREDMAEMVSRAGSELPPEIFEEAKRQRETA